MAVKYKRDEDTTEVRRRGPASYVPPKNRIGFAVMGIAIVLVFLLTYGKMALWPTETHGRAVLLEKALITLASGNKVYVLTLRVDMGSARTATGRWRVNAEPAAAFNVGDTVDVVYEWSFRSSEVRILECRPLARAETNP
jgi:hypothetical protein